ncbi:fimbria/pilus periplasmic chaperone [Achromobacter xylosoxidans]
MVVPFIVSPALTRVEPDGSALLRVFHAKRPLPTDRESLFYLNVMETPPRSSEENALTLQFRTGSSCSSVRPDCPEMPGTRQTA